MTSVQPATLLRDGDSCVAAGPSEWALSLDAAVAQLFCVGLPDDPWAAVAAIEAGGPVAGAFMVYRESLHDGPANFATAVAAIHFAADHEGGHTRLLDPPATEIPLAMALGAIPVPASAGRAAALVARSARVLACAKHFPGHGDTAVDNSGVAPAMHAAAATLFGRVSPAGRLPVALAGTADASDRPSDGARGESAAGGRRQSAGQSTAVTPGIDL